MLMRVQQNACASSSDNAVIKSNQTISQQLPNTHKSRGVNENMYINSAKKVTSSHCQLRLFSSNLTCVNICMNITRFNNWDVNWTSSTDMWLTEIEWCVHEQRGVKIKSNSQYLVWPPAALNTAVHLLLMDCTRFASSFCEMLHHSSTKEPASSRTFLGGNALALTLRSNRSQTCSMGLRSGLFAGHGRTLTFLSCRKSQNEQYGWWHCHVRMNLQER